MADHPAARLADVVIRTGPSADIVQKLLVTVEVFGAERRLLVVGSDAPVLTPESLADVISRCPEDCAVFYPVVASAASSSQLSVDWLLTPDNW